MTEQGLPVPRPLAAMCVRGGLYYRGALLTRTIPGARPLAELLDIVRLETNSVHGRLDVRRLK